MQSELTDCAAVVYVADRVVSNSKTLELQEWLYFSHKKILIFLNLLIVNQLKMKKNEISQKTDEFGVIFQAKTHQVVKNFG